MNGVEEDEALARALYEEGRRSAARGADSKRRSQKRAGKALDRYLKDQPKKEKDNFYDGKKKK